MTATAIIVDTPAATRPAHRADLRDTSRTARARDPRTAAVEAGLAEIIDSPEPALVFTSAATLRAASPCDECTVAIVEDGPFAYRIRQSRSGTDTARPARSSRGASHGTRERLTTQTVVVPIREPARSAGPDYTGAVVLAWRGGHRPDSTDSALARAVIAHAIGVVEHSRRLELAAALRLLRHRAGLTQRRAGSDSPGVTDGWTCACTVTSTWPPPVTSPGMLEALDAVAAVIWIDLSDVDFLDSSGIEPVVQLTRARAARDLPRDRIGSCRPAARRLLNLTRLDGHPDLDDGQVSKPPTRGADKW